MAPLALFFLHRFCYRRPTPVLTVGVVSGIVQLAEDTAIAAWGTSAGTRRVEPLR
jgi:hypothetical protein